jgi:hypothetical protein
MELVKYRSTYLYKENAYHPEGENIDREADCLPSTIELVCTAEFEALQKRVHKMKLGHIIKLICMVNTGYMMRLRSDIIAKS